MPTCGTLTVREQPRRAGRELESLALVAAGVGIVLLAASDRDSDKRQ